MLQWSSSTIAAPEQMRVFQHQCLGTNMAASISSTEQVCLIQIRLSPGGALLKEHS